MNNSIIVKDHYQTHSITEIDHIPDHDERKDTLEFINAKKVLEKVEHLGCYICGTMENRQSHHIFERCWSNAYDFKKVAKMLYNHFDFHGHCNRDFKSEDELFNFFVSHYNCNDTALDTIYNQLIICDQHHIAEGHSAHGSTFATFVAWMGHKDGYVLSMSPKEYSDLQHISKK